MIQFSNVSKAFGTQYLFNDVTFALGRGERLGLIGRNGSGKSTVIKMITGEEHPDSGQIVFPSDYHCGHLAQHLHFSRETIVDEVCTGLHPDQHGESYRAEILLAGLGFSQDDMTRPAQYFSGGFQIRVDLARVLIAEPNLLLLDEPTNYLDIVSLRWLERFLCQWPNELILISHDRAFMDSVITHCMLIRRAKVRKMRGTTAQLYAQVEQEEEIYEKTRLNQESKKRDMEVFINRFRAKASKAAVVQSRVKALERMGSMEELQDETELDFKFREAPFPGKCVLEAAQIGFHYPPRDEREPQWLIRDLSLQISKNDRIGIIGKNGKGKSTLLRLLAGELTPNAGEIKLSPNTSLGYFGQTNIERLSPKRNVVEEISDVNPTLSRTEVRNICGTMMFSGDSALKKISVLSGGERSRVLIGRILARRSNLLLLDEPTNHLDQESVATMLESLKVYAGAVLVVTHNELILRELATRLIVFQGDVPQIFEGNYDYFLEKIGWDGEVSDGPSARTNGARKGGTPEERRSAAEDRRNRATQRQERARTLKPIESRIKLLEDEICDMEEKIKRTEAELVDASNKSDGARIGALSRDLAVARASIDRAFDQLSAATVEHEAAKAELE